jgi:hypothetical protein
MQPSLFPPAPPLRADDDTQPSYRRPDGTLNVIPFGKFRGWSVRRVPYWWANWALDQRWLRADLRQALEGELDRRFSGA